jgi:hypothetical protein
MYRFITTVFITSLIFGLSGCSHKTLIRYNEAEPTNWVDVKLVSGRSVQGSVDKVEPHQLSIMQKDGATRIIAKSSIRSLKRKTPVKDYFGKGISELEIASVKKSTNTIVYGVGGGILSFGVSFFAGSMASKNSESGGAILAGATLGGSTLGTLLFVRAGAAKDRRDAIATIRERRRSVEIQSAPAEKPDKEAIQAQLKEEKEKQEALRKKREEILRQLQEKEKK